MQRQTWIPVLGWTLLAAGCGGGDGTDDPGDPIVPGTASIDVSVSPSMLTIDAGTSGAAEVLITRDNFGGPVLLTVSTPPAGVTASINPASTTSNNATVTLATTSAATGSHVLMIRAVAQGPAGELRDSVALSVVLRTVAGASIDVSVNPTALTLDAGTSGTVNVTIARVNFAGSVALSVNAGPSGITSTIAPTGTTGNSATLTLVTTAAASIGTHNFMVRGTASGPLGPLADSAAVSLTVRAVVAGGRWSQLSAGLTHTCGVTTQNVAYCFGEGGVGHLGNGSNTARSTPTAVSGALPFRSVSAGSDHTCGVTTANAGYCWGGGNLGQLGQALNAHNSTPIQVVGVSFTSIAAGNGFTCGVATNGSGQCWGDGGSGQLGTGSTASRNIPAAVIGGHTFTAITTAKRLGALGPGFSCGLVSGGAAYCWGTGSSGELGTGGTTTSSAPVAVAGGLTFTSISAGANHVCAVTAAGAAYCWGEGDAGRLGNGSTQDRSTPTPVSGGLTFSAIAAGVTHTCAVRTGGVAYCWGDGGFGRLGNGTTDTAMTPSAVVGGNLFTSVTAGGFHSCGVGPGAVAYCWGNGGDGRLGNGQTLQSTTPVRVIDP